jgi:hypothetical protein
MIPAQGNNPPASHKISELQGQDNGTSDWFLDTSAADNCANFIRSLIKTTVLVTLGKAKKVSADLQVHIDADFIIWLAKDEWRMLSPKQQNALVDHELSHCFWDGLTASMKSHDVEEFTHIIERYGFWWPNSSDFRLAVQEALPIPRETPGSVGTIDFGKIAEAVAKEMNGDGVEVTYHPATGRGE